MTEQAYSLDTTWRTLLKDLGIAPANVLRRAGLPDDLLQQPSVRLAAGDFYRLWDSIEVESGESLFPLRVCQAVRSESFSPLLFAALCSPNLLIAAQRISRFKPLIAPILVDVLQAQSFITVELTWLDNLLSPPASLVVLELLFCVTLARIGTREQIRPIEVTTTVLPSPLAPYEEFLGARLKRGAKHQIKFTVVDATRPFLTSNELLWAAFEPELRLRLSDLSVSATTTMRVQAALLEGFPSGLVMIEDIARKLALSKRTLQRRLESESTSFQEILSESRASLARHYLAKTTLSIAEISFLLGFEEQNSFYRAFRAWAGSTPEAVRSQAKVAAARESSADSGR